MISRSDNSIKDMFEEYLTLGEEADTEYSSFENFFDDVDIFINEMHDIKAKNKLNHYSSIKTLINLLQIMDPQDYGIYEDGGEEHSLITGDYDLPDDGHEPLLLANYFEIKNEKSNQSIFLIEIKDNAGGDYYCPDGGSARLILDDCFIKPTDAKSAIEGYVKQATE